MILNYLRRRSDAHELSSAGHTSTSAATRDEDALFYPLTDDSTLDVRSRSVLSVARRFDYDVAHSHHVALLAMQIFDDTKELHELSDQDRKLLQYAAILHDIGYHIAHNNHHRHALYLIKNSEMPGFTGDEIAMMGAMVRYHRGSLPRKNTDSRSRREHEDYYALDRKQRARLLRLASILQIADGLDRSHRQSISNVACRIERNAVTFIPTLVAESELELWSAERKSAWFAEIFDVEVRFERLLPTSSQAESAVAV